MIINIKNSQEFHEITKHIREKEFKEALEKTKSIALKYHDNQVLHKLFVHIYFSLKEWERAIESYKKLLNFKKNRYGIWIYF